MQRCFGVDSYYRKGGTHTYNKIKTGKAISTLEFADTPPVKSPTVKNKKRKLMQKGKALKRLPNTHTHTQKQVLEFE